MSVVVPCASIMDGVDFIVNLDTVENGFGLVKFECGPNQGLVQILLRPVLRAILFWLKFEVVAFAM